MGSGMARMLLAAVVVVLGTGAPLAPAAPLPADPAADRLRQVDSYLDAYAEANGIPGLAVGVVGTEVSGTSTSGGWTVTATGSPGTAHS